MLPYRPTPVPLAAAALLLALWVMTASSDPMTRTLCDNDLDELLSEIETNRQAAIKHIAGQLAEPQSAQRRRGLLNLQEETWDQEERQRGQANYLWRDCLKAVNG